jgi:hypothetical protein
MIDNVFQLLLPLPDKRGYVQFRVETGTPLPADLYGGALLDAARAVIGFAEALGWQNQPGGPDSGTEQP